LHQNSLLTAGKHHKAIRPKESKHPRGKRNRK